MRLPLWSIALLAAACFTSSTLATPAAFTQPQKNTTISAITNTFEDLIQAGFDHIDSIGYNTDEWTITHLMGFKSTKDQNYVPFTRASDVNGLNIVLQKDRQSLAIGTLWSSTATRRQWSEPDLFDRKSDPSDPKTWTLQSRSIINLGAAMGVLEERGVRGPIVWFTIDIPRIVPLSDREDNNDIWYEFLQVDGEEMVLQHLNSDTGELKTQTDHLDPSAAQKLS